MEEPLRIRLVFDRRKMLTKFQRSEGLKRCWLLLNPEIATISDLESHVYRSFDLKRSCPHGLILSMDGFVLPPFESTSILKDKDIIRVREKEATWMDAIDLGDDWHCIQDSGVLEKQHPASSHKLLAIGQSGEDSGHERKNDEALPAHNENAVYAGTPLKSKNKRKHSDDIQGSKKKKLKVTEDKELHLGKTLESSQDRSSSPKISKKKKKPSTVDETAGVASDLEDDVELLTNSIRREKRRKKSRLIDREKEIVTFQGAEDTPIEQNQNSYQKGDSSVKCLHRKGTQIDEDGRSDDVFSTQADGNLGKKRSSVRMKERIGQAEENIAGGTCEQHVNGSTTKVSSRSTRRKRAKKQRLRELKSQQDQNTQSQVQQNVILSELPEQQEAGKNRQNQLDFIPSDLAQQQETGKTSEPEKEIVPVIIRPGHIRFQSLDEEKTQWPSHESTESLQWTGTTSKEKGQKWGREKTTSHWNDANGFTEQYHRKMKSLGNRHNADDYKGQQLARRKTTNKWNDGNGGNGQKWPREMAVIRGNDANSYKEQSNGKKTASKWNDADGQEKGTTKSSSWNDPNSYKEQPNRKALSGNGKTGSGHVDFESLFPLTRIPQVGDVLVYRLIELSSSLCPEVSCFRVGQVTSYNYLSMSIILVPVPEYPILSDEDVEKRDYMLQANSSPYNEDGSLQIHYPSLIDVCLLKASNSEATTSDCPGEEPSAQVAAPVNNWELAQVNNSANSSEAKMSTKPITCTNNREQTLVNSTAQAAVAASEENGNAGGSTWDQIKQALNEKKAQLLQEKDGWDEWTQNKSSSSTSWSCKALRRSGVGLTLAYLRGKNNKHPHKK